MFSIILTSILIGNIDQKDYKSGPVDAFPNPSFNPIYSFCVQNLLDTQERGPYTASRKKEVHVN